MTQLKQPVVYHKKRKKFEQLNASQKQIYLENLKNLSNDTAIVFQKPKETALDLIYNAPLSSKVADIDKK